jgi:hypothetical protein
VFHLGDQNIVVFQHFIDSGKAGFDHYTPRDSCTMYALR